VKRLQIDLNNCYSRFHTPLAVDGEYGPATENAVKIVQGIEGVPQDGDYGPVTIRGSNSLGPFSYQVSGSSAGQCDFIRAS
jgi:peptidoglycan hydrolase-like protein with peptidoglycan-binding domain